ncbi:MAG: HAMP domain-containing histidine kinase [Phycisphaeraceae bacterium]|nr:HAMP domain-containing histidine kinase [Phycisphaeraceae bacterium]
MAKPVRISLANKCQLLFGAAVVLILTAALAVPWLRMQTLVAEGQEETARRLAEAWLAGKIELGTELRALHQLPDDSADEEEKPVNKTVLALIGREDFELAASQDDFLGKAIETFQTREDKQEYFQPADGTHGRVYYQFARAIRKSDLSSIRRGLPSGFASAVDSTSLANPLEMVLWVRMRTDLVESQLLRNRIYVIAAGLLAGLLAIGVFWYITMRLILSPVRVLRDTAEKVSEGDLNIRSEISTGDEFEQLSGTFNTMLESLKNNQDQLRNVNKSLDLKIGELAKTNLSLYETSKIKSEFLANVSHELRTPLHSIVGFAEVLQETLEGRTGPVDEKRKRYASNIIASSRQLLDLINDLLDLAKIEAGRLELHVSKVSIADIVEGLVNLIRPQAEKKQVELRIKVERDIPPVETDAGKVQQILFNFLSNAIKFAPQAGSVVMSAGLLRSGNGASDGHNGHAPDSPAPAPSKADSPDSAPVSTGSLPGAGALPGGLPGALPGGAGVSGVRISVTDNGPGIALEDHQRIFEKFVQLDKSVTREYGGTGLGLTISRDLAKMLEGQIELDSDIGRGATFSLILPLELGARQVALMPGSAPAKG